MTGKLKLSTGELQHLLKEAAALLLKEQQYPEADISAFHEKLAYLGLEELYRPIILGAFLREREPELKERQFSLLFKEESELPSDIWQLESEGGELIVFADDLPAFIVPGLILSSENSPERLLPAHAELLEELAHTKKAIEAQQTGTGGDDAEAEQTNEEQPPDIWDLIGKELAKEVLRKCSNYPPPGFRVKKVGRGFVFLRDSDQDEGPPLLEYLLELGFPLIHTRQEKLKQNKSRLEKDVEERKSENKRLLDKVKDLESQLRKLKKEKLEVHRTARTLKKSNKQMKRRLKTTKDENEYEGMYG